MIVCYHLIVGPGSIFDGSKRTKNEIVASNKKIMFAALGGQELVPWTKPGGFKIEQYNQELGAEYFLEGTPFCTFDGRARLLTREDLYIQLSQPAAPGIRDSTFKQYANPMTFEHPNTEVESFPNRRLRIRVTAVERKK